jgi:hypothetical protein
MAVACPPTGSTEGRSGDPPVDPTYEDGKTRFDEGKAKRWSAFLTNHREVIAALDFFTVPTLTFRLLYGFFVVEHDHRRIVHFNVTAHPTCDWIQFHAA